MKEQRLIDAPVGLFLHDGTLCLKTEYRSGKGGVEAYIVDSGEFFCGGVATSEERNNLMVTPLDYEVQTDKAVIREPGKKIKHQYFFSYDFIKNGFVKSGFCQIFRIERISTFSDIVEVTETLKKSFDTDSVVIRNFIELDPITEDEEG